MVMHKKTMSYFFPIHKNKKSIKRSKRHLLSKGQRNWVQKLMTFFRFGSLKHLLRFFSKTSSELDLHSFHQIKITKKSIGNLCTTFWKHCNAKIQMLCRINVGLLSLNKVTINFNYANVRWRNSFKLNFPLFQDIFY